MSAKQWMIAFVIAGISTPVVSAPESFTIDPAHTYPSLEMSHRGLSIWRGKFNKTTGKVTLDRAAKTGAVSIVVDTASIDWGHDKMNEHAVGPDWLNVAQYPTMSYQGKIRFTGDAPSSVDGNLTLLGVTKPLVLQINSFACGPHPLSKKLICGADAEGELNRVDFGMKKYADGKAEIIHLRIQVEATKD